MVTLAAAYLVSCICCCGDCSAYEGNWRQNGNPDSRASRGYADSSQCSAQNHLANDCAYSCSTGSSNASDPYDLGSFASHIRGVGRSG